MTKNTTKWHYSNAIRTRDCKTTKKSNKIHRAVKKKDVRLRTTFVRLPSPPVGGPHPLSRTTFVRLSYDFCTTFVLRKWYDSSPLYYKLLPETSRKLGNMFYPGLLSTPSPTFRLSSVSRLGAFPWPGQRASRERNPVILTNSAADEE